MESQGEVWRCSTAGLPIPRPRLYGRGYGPNTGHQRSAMPGLGSPHGGWPSQEALVCKFLEAASIALTLAMRS